MGSLSYATRWADRPALQLCCAPPRHLLEIYFSRLSSGCELRCAPQGESLSFQDTVTRLMDKLQAAGVGSRPVVFVGHSMGGLLVKEMLAKALAEEPGSRHHGLAATTRGVVFYGTPHFGSNLAAMGWGLRHVPGKQGGPAGRTGRWRACNGRMMRCSPLFSG